MTGPRTEAELSRPERTASDTPRNVVRAEGRAAASGAVLLVAGLGGVLLLAHANDVSLSALTRDVSTTAGLPWYTGTVSTVGVVLWAVGSAIAVFAAGLVGGAERRLLLGLGVLGATLAMDDALLLHEKALPELFGSDAAELAVYAVYGAALLVIVRTGREEWMGPGFFVFVSGLVFLGASVAVDAVGSFPAFAEDSLKFTGIVGWSTGLMRRAAAVLRS